MLHTTLPDGWFSWRSRAEKFGAWAWSTGEGTFSLGWVYQSFKVTVLSYYKYHSWSFISSNFPKSYSQYLNIVEATRCTFCFFRTSMSCICFFIAKNKSFICFYSLFPAYELSYPLCPPLSIALAFSSFNVCVSPFNFSCPFVSCCKTLLLSPFAVAAVCIFNCVHFK